MDPFGGGVVWNPAYAGGYGVAGDGVYTNFSQPSLAAGMVAANAQMYHDSGGDPGRFGNKYGTRVYTAGMTTHMYNPWMGSHIGNDTYSGGWMELDFGVMAKIILKGYEIKTNTSIHYEASKVGAPQQTQGEGDKKNSGSEFNVTFTFGLVAGLNIGDWASIEARLWTFGEIGTKSDFSDEEWGDGKITSTHYLSGGLGSVTYGRGWEDRMGYRSGEFYVRDHKDIYTNWGVTTKVDPVTKVESKDIHTTILFLGLGIFSIEFTKDWKK